MKVRIVASLCQGHGMCILANREVFSLDDDDGHAYVTQADVPPDLEEAVRQAERGCPERAIEIY
jgi:ferredoxin